MSSRKNSKKARKSAREVTILGGGNVIGVAEKGATVVQRRACMDDDDFDTQTMETFVERGATDPLFAALAPILMELQGIRDSLHEISGRMAMNAKGRRKKRS